MQIFTALLQSLHESSTSSPEQRAIHSVSKQKIQFYDTHKLELPA